MYDFETILDMKHQNQNDNSTWAIYVFVTNATAQYILNFLKSKFEH